MERLAIWGWVNDDGSNPYWYYGLELSVLRTVGDQPTLWEALLPPEVLVMSPELARVDALLDDDRFFEPFAAHLGCGGGSYGMGPSGGLLSGVG